MTKESLAQTQEPVPVTDNTYGYAKFLAEAIFKQHFSSDEHYASGRIVWGVNDTVIGILTQIDNMVADMVRRPAQPEDTVQRLIALVRAQQVTIDKLEAQPEQEPINDGWQITFANGHSGFGVYAHMDEHPEEGSILLCAVPQWAKEAFAQPAQPQQKSVAWMHTMDNTEGHKENKPYVLFTKSKQNPFGVAGRDYSKSYPVTKQPLYTSPPQRPWRGLSDDEALECWPGLAMYADCAKFWENIEAKLKAKNDN